MKSIRPIITTLLMFSAAPVFPSANEYMPPVTDERVIGECSACHMAYPAGFLPERSWKKIMATLDDHFGENAELDDEMRTAIENYLSENAADARGWLPKFLRREESSEIPLRITDMRWFISEHDGEVSASKLAKAGSMSNCVACHRGANQGNFDD